MPPAPDSGGRNKLPLLLAGGGVVVVGIVAAVLFATGVFGGGGPEGTVRELFAAGQSEDCEQMVSLASTTALGDTSREDAIAACEQGFRQAASEEFEQELVETEVTSEDGDQATVAATVRSWRVGHEDDAEQNTSEIQLVREDGDWKVDNFVLGAAGSQDADGTGQADTPDVEELPDFDEMTPEELEEWLKEQEN